MTKKIIVVILSLNFFYVTLANAQDMLTDLAIPLMAGLEEQAEESLLFDSPEGRIINAAATGKVMGADVYQFYLMVLPSLGWQVVPENNSSCSNGVELCLEALREDEKIILNIENKNNTSVVTYSLSPN